MSFFPQILVILSQFIVANWEKQRRLGKCMLSKNVKCEKNDCK